MPCHRPTALTWPRTGCGSPLLTKNCTASAPATMTGSRSAGRRVVGLQRRRPRAAINAWCLPLPPNSPPTPPSLSASANLNHSLNRLAVAAMLRHNTRVVWGLRGSKGLINLLKPHLLHTLHPCAQTLRHTPQPTGHGGSGAQDQARAVLRQSERSCAPSGQHLPCPTCPTCLARRHDAAGVVSRAHGGSGRCVASRELPARPLVIFCAAPAHARRTKMVRRTLTHACTHSCTPQPRTQGKLRTCTHRGNNNHACSGNVPGRARTEEPH